MTKKIPGCGNTPGIFFVENFELLHKYTDIRYHTGHGGFPFRHAVNGHAPAKETKLL